MTVVTSTLLQHVVDAAAQAPSMHNSQPWKWRATDTGLELRADRTRWLMRADREGRNLVISCGAALHTLLVAAAAQGVRARVRRMPNPVDPDLLAEVRFEAEPATEEAVALAEAVAARRTDRRTPSSWPVPAERLFRLTTLASDLGVRAVDVSQGRGRLSVPTLLQEAERLQGLDKGYHDELLAWTQPEGGLGVPRPNVPSREDSTTEAGGSRFPSGDLTSPSGSDASGAAWLLLTTSSDDPLSWLRTGEALQACWLWTTLEGMVLVPFSQPLEVERTRARIQREVLDDTSCPQLLLRIGWPALAAPPVPPTPRLPLDDVFED